MVVSRRAHISGLGTYLPQKILSNHDLEQLVETSDEWIVSRTGIKERRIASPDETASMMGAASAKAALLEAGVVPSEIDLILTATMTPDYISPSTAGLIQHQIGATNAAAVDIQAACSGFLYALSMAKAYVESGMYKNVLLTATEKMSAFMDYKDRNTCILFGDGACSAVISSQAKGWAIDAISLGADGGCADLVIIPAGGSATPSSHETVDQRLHYLRMQGKEVFKHAVRRMSTAANDCIAQAGLSMEQIDWLVPHQANERIIDAIAKACEISQDKVFKTLHKYGNTSASSIAIALEELTHKKEIHQGSHALLVAFGGGLTWGASVLTKI